MDAIRCVAAAAFLLLFIGIHHAWNAVVSKNPIDVKTECRFGRGLDVWIGRQATDDPRLW